MSDFHPKPKGKSLVQQDGSRVGKWSQGIGEKRAGIIGGFPLASCTPFPGKIVLPFGSHALTVAGDGSAEIKKNRAFSTRMPTAIGLG